MCLESFHKNTNMSGSARMCSDNEFYAAGPACEKARSPHLVHSCGSERSNDDVDLIRCMCWLKVCWPVVRATVVSASGSTVHHLESLNRKTSGSCRLRQLLLVQSSKSRSVSVVWCTVLLFCWVSVRNSSDFYPSLTKLISELQIFGKNLYPVTTAVCVCMVFERHAVIGINRICSTYGNIHSIPELRQCYWRIIYSQLVIWDLL